LTPGNALVKKLCYPLQSTFPTFCSGQDTKSSSDTDADSGKGTLNSYDSVNSLESNSSSLNTSTAVVQDSPEQYEVLKHQKEIMEHGIEM